MGFYLILFFKFFFFWGEGEGEPHFILCFLSNFYLVEAYELQKLINIMYLF